MDDITATNTDLASSDARHLTDRIKVALEATWQMIRDAYLGRAWIALGYTSWDDYTTQEFGTARIRIPREDRQEWVGSLRDSGLSIRAIAQATALSVGTIHADTQVFKTEHLPAEVSDAHHEFPTADEWSPDGGFVNSGTGEVMESYEPPAPPSPRAITGIDGKTYSTPVKREPQPLATRDEADYDNAKTGCVYLGRALETMLGLTYPERRHLFIDEWWPLAKDEVPPSQRELLNPAQLREMAQGLVSLANELETAR